MIVQTSVKNSSAEVYPPPKETFRFKTASTVCISHTAHHTHTHTKCEIGDNPLTNTAQRMSLKEQLAG